MCSVGLYRRAGRRTILLRLALIGLLLLLELLLQALLRGGWRRQRLLVRLLLLRRRVLRLLRLLLLEDLRLELRRRVRRILHRRLLRWREWLGALASRRHILNRRHLRHRRKRRHLREAGCLPVVGRLLRLILRRREIVGKAGRIACGHARWLDRCRLELVAPLPGLLRLYLSPKPSEVLSIVLPLDDLALAALDAPVLQVRDKHELPADRVDAGMPCHRHSSRRWTGRDGSNCCEHCLLLLRGHVATAASVVLVSCVREPMRPQALQ